MNRPKSIFRRAAEGGLTLGVIFVCIFLLGTVTGPLMGLLALFLMIYVPVYVYRNLKATYFSAHGLMTFSGLWLEGILLFVCASILLALGSFIFMRVIVPDYVPAVSRQIVAFLEANPQMNGTSMSTQQLGASFASIRPIDISMTLMWGASFTGSIASLVIAGIVKSKIVPPANPSDNN